METEERARQMGWMPEDEFKGDPKRWTNAETWVEKGETMIPIMRSQMGKYEKTIQSLNSKLTEMDQTFKDFSKYHKDTAEREQGKAIEEIKSQQREAVEMQDTDAYDALEAKKKVIEEGPEKTNGPPPEFTEWVGSNEWYNDDMEMGQYADFIGNRIATSKPGVSTKDLYGEVEKAVKKKYPGKFENQNRNLQQSVDTGGDTSPRKAKSKAYASLPSDAKASCDRFVSQGLLTKDQFCAEYDWEE